MDLAFACKSSYMGLFICILLTWFYHLFVKMSCMGLFHCVDWDVKHPFKQTNNLIVCSLSYMSQFLCVDFLHESMCI